MTATKEKQRKNYLEGFARRPHLHSRTLRRSLEGAGPSRSTDGASANPSICPQCYPGLVCYVDVFKSMKQSGTELKKCKRSNPYPKKADSDVEHHRDITKQNDWLRSDVFDSLGKYSVLRTHYHPLTQYIHVLNNTLSFTPTHTGNYLYCLNCIKAAFGISNDRLASQR